MSPYIEGGGSDATNSLATVAGHRPRGIHRCRSTSAFPYFLPRRFTFALRGAFYGTKHGGGHLTHPGRRRFFGNHGRPRSYSPTSPTARRAPADVDGDGAASILDIVAVAGDFTEAVPPAPERYDQDADALISILDLTRMANVFLEDVTDCD